MMIDMNHKLNNIKQSNISKLLISTFLLASLSAAGCREVPGACGKAAETLCLAAELADTSVVPKTLRLTLSALGIPPRTQDYDVGAVIAQRPYFIEVTIGGTAVDTIDINCVGYQNEAGDVGMPVVSGSKSVMRSTADRPTYIRLFPMTPTNDDLASPTEDLSSPGDMRASPGDMRNMAPSDASLPSDFMIMLSRPE